MAELLRRGLEWRPRRLPRLALPALMTLAAGHLPAQEFHPADADADHRLTTSEIGDYYNEALGPLDPAERDADLVWQQAEFIWLEGGTYENVAGLPSPANWRPVRDGADFVSVLPHRALPFEALEVHGLPEGSPVVGRFRPDGSRGWIALGAVEAAPGGAHRFRMPYVPWHWPASHWIEVEFETGGRTYTAGRLRLERIEVDAGMISRWFEDLDLRLGRYLSGDPLEVGRLALEDPATVTDSERLVAYMALAARETAEALEEQHRAPGSPDDEEAARIVAELIALNLGSASAAIHDRLADAVREDGGAAPAPAQAGPHAGGPAAADLPPRAEGGPGALGACEPVRNWSELVLKTKDRCELEAAAAEDGVVKELTDEAVDKLKEVGEKLGKRLVEDSEMLRKRVLLPIEITLKIREFINAWSLGMLPKSFTDLRFELRDGLLRPVPLDGALLEDSPYPSGECDSISVEVFASIRSEGFSTAKFALDQGLPGADDLGEFGRFFQDQIGDLRDDVIDGIHERIKDKAFDTPPCEWTDIEVPHTRDNPLLDLTPLNDVFVINPSLPAGFDPARVGSGSIRVELRTTGSTSASDNLPCTASFSEDLSFRVDPIRITPEPPAISVTDLQKPVDLRATIRDSWEHEKLEWWIYNVRGELVHRETTNMTTRLSETSARHVLRQFDPPDDFRDYPLLVNMESLAQGCISQSEGPRQAVSLIFYDKKVFELTPNRECFEPGSVISVQAIPAEADPDFRIVDWEVVSGGGTLSNEAERSVTLELPDEPRAEVVLRAVGADDFEGYAYFSVGPCLDWVALNLLFPEGSLVEGDRFQTNTSLLLVGYNGSGPQVAPVLTPGLNPLGSSFEVVPAVLAFGKADVFVGSIEPVPDRPTVRKAEIAADGVFISIVDTGATILSTSEPSAEVEAEAQHTGTYFDEFAPERHDYEFAPGFADYERVDDLLEVTDDEYTFPVSIDFRVDPEGISFANTSVSWSSDNGEYTPLSTEFEDDDRINRALFTYPRSEEAPSYTILISGTVTRPKDGGFESFSIQSRTTITLHKIEIGALSTIEIDTAVDGLTFCIAGNPLMPPPPGFLTTGCCGGIELAGYSKTRGSVRQQLMISGLFDLPELPGRTRALSLFGSGDPEVPFCTEVKEIEKKKKAGEYPCPPPPPPDGCPPDCPPPPPDGETPPELVPFFATTPVQPVTTSFPNAPASDSGSASSGGGWIEGHPIRYPYSVFTTGELFLGEFDAGTGVLTASRNLMDAATADFLATELRVAAYVALPGGRRALLVDREAATGPYRFLDLLELDEASGKLIGRRLFEHDGSVTVVGVADFDGDGFSDYGGVDEDGNFVFHAGGPDGVAEEAASFFPAQAGWTFRAAGALPGGNTLLVAEGVETLEARIFVVDPAGGLVTTHTMARPNVVESPQAVADFNDDGVPDLVFQQPFGTTATVQILEPDGGIDTGNTLTLSGLPFAAQLPGPPFF